MFPNHGTGSFGAAFRLGTVEAAPISEYLLKPIHEETPFDGAWALFNGGVQHVYVALHDSGDQILVDESTTMGAATALSQGTVSQVAWDTLELDGVAPGDLELWVETGDGGRHDGTVALVDDVDEIVVDENIIELTDPVTVGSLATGCFRASRDGATVVGADWEYSFDGLHHTARGHRRRNAQQKMHVVRANVTLDYFDIVAPTYLADQLAYSQTYFPSENRFAVFRDKHKVVMESVYCVRPFTITAHPGIIPQTS